MAQGLTSHDPAIAKQGKPMVTSGRGPANGKKVLTDGCQGKAGGDFEENACKMTSAVL